MYVCVSVVSLSTGEIERYKNIRVRLPSDNYPDLPNLAKHNEIDKRFRNMTFNPENIYIYPPYIGEASSTTGT